MLRARHSRFSPIVSGACPSQTIDSYNVYRQIELKTPQDIDLSNDYNIDEVIEMALSDHTSFGDIERLYGLSADDVKRIMRQNLKRGSYEAWRRRVRKFSDRREHYK